MIVEIKAQISKKQVEERLERLKKFRKYEEEAEIKGKKLFGAIAAIYLYMKAVLMMIFAWFGTSTMIG
jgi:hypothetical protein